MSRQPLVNTLNLVRDTFSVSLDGGDQASFLVQKTLSEEKRQVRNLGWGGRQEAGLKQAKGKGQVLSAQIVLRERQLDSTGWTPWKSGGLWKPVLRLTDVQSQRVNPVEMMEASGFLSSLCRQDLMSPPSQVPALLPCTVERSSG